MTEYLPGPGAGVKPIRKLQVPPGLYPVCDDGLDVGLDWLTQAQLALEGGARILQLRLKHTALRERITKARRVVAWCEEKGALCLINDRVDVALIVGAHGVHLGDEDLSPQDARKVLPKGSIVGVTVRDAAGARGAYEAGADYVGMGPVFATRTKHVPAPVMGLERLAVEVRESPLPVVAIGGVSLVNIEAVARAGVHAAAVVSDLWRSTDVPARFGQLQAAFDQGRSHQERSHQGRSQ